MCSVRLAKGVAAGLLLAVPAWAGELAAGDRLRAVFLATNPAQARIDPATGERRGPSLDLARELARRDGLRLEFRAVDDPPAVVEAVRSGNADVGFVAFEATRLGSVEFSQAYMLVRQSFLVAEASPIRTVTDIDRSGQAVGGTRNDSITLCLKRILRHADAVEVPNDPAAIGRALGDGTLHAFAANRQRLTALMQVTPGTRLLPDDLFDVPQNVVVPKDRPGALAAVNAAIDELRGSGALQASVERGGAVGVVAAPAGARAGCPERAPP